MDAATDVRFDFEGSLNLARRLWALADEVDTLMANRVSLARAALSTWLGVYGTQFAGRIETEATSSTGIANELRGAATGWATCWQQAMDEQNRVLYAREVKQVEDERSGWDSFWGGLTGHDDLPDQPSPVATPSAPGFHATASLARY